ncbi:MAG: hypothetical protein HY454_04055 [Parcubacteria group bacterium]|nr:hypothetical protein [Parcubacteria group bacterium]
MAHAEIIQNGVVIIKPDSRLKRAINAAQQFLARVGKKIPGLRSLVRHELMLRWLHREIHDFSERQKYRGKAVYIALDEKILSGVKDLAALVRENSKFFIPIEQLESGMRNAFGLINREKIRGEIKRKTKKKVQTFKPVRR